MKMAIRWGNTMVDTTPTFRPQAITWLTTHSGLVDDAHAVALLQGRDLGYYQQWRWKVSEDTDHCHEGNETAGKKIAQIDRVTELSRATVYRVKQVEGVGL